MTPLLIKKQNNLMNTDVIPKTVTTVTIHQSFISTQKFHNNSIKNPFPKIHPLNKSFLAADFCHLLGNFPRDFGKILLNNVPVIYSINLWC